MEQQSRKSVARPKAAGARFFSVSRADGTKQPSTSTPGITIQIRLKRPPEEDRVRLLTRQNTEFWLSAND